MEIDGKRPLDTVGDGKVLHERLGFARFTALAQDVATMGAATILSAVFNTALVFLVPRVISVQDFGYWRLFLLYGAYAGLLQMGFLDGLLLRWAGRPFATFHSEILPSLKFLLWQLLVPVGLAGVIILFTLHSIAVFIGVAVLLYSVLFNVNALMQYSLQASRQFAPLAVATVAPLGIFLVLTFTWNLRRTPDFWRLIFFYCLAWAIALIYVWSKVKPLEAGQCQYSPMFLGRSCILIGWPIVLANVGFGLVQSADRFVVSWLLPLNQFAQYSLASSAMFVPVTAIAAIYRVFFSHAAALQNEDRSRIYSHTSRFLLLAWSALLPYFFVLEVVVKNFLPKYYVALPAAGILSLSILFVAEIQILHVSFAYIYGKQRQFLLSTLAALILAFGVGLSTASLWGSLVAVASGQVAALLLWWFVNEWTLRATTGQTWLSQLALLTLFVWSTISFALAMKFTMNVSLRIFIYYALVSPCLVGTCFAEFRILWKLMSRALPQAAH